MPRVEFSRKDRAKIIARANGKCEVCGAVLKKGEGEVDHILPCELGGEATVANGRLLCRVCHAVKTKQDVRAIRKSDRQRDKDSGAVRPKGFQSRGFDKRERNPKPSLPPRPMFEPADQRGRYVKETSDDDL